MRELTKEEELSLEAWDEFHLRLESLANYFNLFRDEIIEIWTEDKYSVTDNGIVPIVSDRCSDYSFRYKNRFGSTILEDFNVIYKALIENEGANK